MIRKTLIAAAVALGIIATPALALNQFFGVKSGQWSIEGYSGEKNFCSAKSYWQNGSYVSLFNMRGSDTFSFIIHNVEWNIDGQIGAFYDSSMIFKGNAGIDVGDAPFELLDSQTIAFRDMSSVFLENWIRFRTLQIVMPNNIPGMNIGLTGTADATSALINCIDHLNN